MIRCYSDQNRIKVAHVIVGDPKGRTDKISIKHHPSTKQFGEDYTVNKLYLVDREMKKVFNEDR